MRLDHEELIDEARRRTSLSDLGDADSLTGLQVLVRSAEEVRPTFASRVSVRQLAMSILVNRLALVDAQRTSPDVFRGPLVPPLIVTGLPRTGTTFLHRILAADPAHYALPLWEAMRPIPAADRKDRRRLRVGLGLAVRKLMIRGLDRIHPISVDAPEEDLFTLGGTFQSWLFWQALPMYGYVDWYLRQDRAAKYQNYRAWLHVLQAAHPGRRLVLKAPEHIGGITELLHAVPEARLVQVHRDPVTAFASFISLISHTQGKVIGGTDTSRRDRTTLQLLAGEMERNLDARERLPDAIVDVYYDELVADPIAVARRIYHEHDVQQSDAAQAAIERFVRANPQGKHGVHRYGASDLAVGADEVSSRFAAYSQRFGFAGPRDTDQPQRPRAT
ncbi:sulfotransferase family protein [Micromonospora chokoriensis]